MGRPGGRRSARPGCRRRPPRPGGHRLHLGDYGTPQGCRALPAQPAVAGHLQPYLDAGPGRRTARHGAGPHHLEHSRPGTAVVVPPGHHRRPVGPIRRRGSGHRHPGTAHQPDHPGPYPGPRPGGPPWGGGWRPGPSVPGHHRCRPLSSGAAGRLAGEVRHPGHHRLRPDRGPVRGDPGTCGLPDPVRRRRLPPRPGPGGDRR